MRKQGAHSPKRSLKSTVLASMMVVTVIALVLSYLIAMVFFYVQQRSAMHDTLSDEAAALSVSLAQEDETSRRLEILTQYHNAAPAPRLTLISYQGEVLYDSEQDFTTMENHADRPEVQAAWESGEGQSVRDSTTVGEDLMYIARALPDNSVIRVSRPIVTAAASALRGLPLLGGVALGMTLLAFVLARKQSASITAPLEKLDLNNPLEGESYPEFEPLLARLDEQNKMKDEAAQSRREFSANVSHELKTPLTSISGYAELIRDEVARPEDVPEFADRIYQESQRLLVLIGDIIALSQLDEASDEGLSKEVLEEVNIFELSKAVTARMLPTARRFGVDLQCSGVPAQVSGNRRLLDEMVSNLVDNAIKYNHAGGHVHVWAGVRMNRPEIVVADDGIGIAPAEQQRVFERFYRVDKSHSKETGGTGLGLSIVKHAALAHGAQINLESKIGEGTRIRITFPE